MVHHGIHRTGRDTEKETGTTQLGEVAEVTMPIWLRNDSYTIPCSFEHTTNDSRAKTGMIHIGITRKEDDIQFVPTTEFHFLGRCWQPVL